MNKPLAIYLLQFQSFKDHAYALSDQLASMHVKYRYTGRKRVDLLAQACGYKSHSQLKVCLKDSIKDTHPPLVIFNKTIGELLAHNLTAGDNSIAYADARAAIMLSAQKLYAGDLAALNTWTAEDYDHLRKSRPFSPIRVRVGNQYTDQLSPASLKRLASIVEQQQSAFRQAAITMQPTLELIRKMNLAVAWPSPKLQKVAETASILTSAPVLKRVIEQQEALAKTFAAIPIGNPVIPSIIFSHIQAVETFSNSGLMNALQHQQELMGKILNPLKP